MGEGYEGIPLEDLRFESVDWTYRAEHVASRSQRKGRDEFDVEPGWASEAVLDPRRIVRPTRGLSLKVVGVSMSAPPRRPGQVGRVLKVWVVPKNIGAGEWWGASACDANADDRRAYERESS